MISFNYLMLILSFRKIKLILLMILKIRRYLKKFKFFKLIKVTTDINFKGKTQ